MLVKYTELKLLFDYCLVSSRLAKYKTGYNQYISK